MDLVRWSDRVRPRVAEHSMAAAKSLAHVRAIDQHFSQRQKCRPKPDTIYLAADCFHESGNTSAVARWVVLGVRFPRRSALYGAWNHIPRHARRVHHFAWQKLLPRARVSDALCGGRRGHRGRFHQPPGVAQTGIAHSDPRDRRASCAVGRADLAAWQTGRVHASYWPATAAYRNFAYRSAAPAFRRSIWLARNGRIGRTRLSSLA